MSCVRIEIRLFSGEIVVHEFQRATTNATRDGIGKMLDAAMGWLQSYQASVSEEQWTADVRRVQRALDPSEVAQLLTDDLQ